MEGPSRPHSPPLLLYMRDLAAAATAAAVALDDGEVGGVLDAQMQIPSLLVLCRADRDHGKRKEARRAGRQGGEPGHGGAPDLASGSPDLAILSPDLPPLPLSVFFCQ